MKNVKNKLFAGFSDSSLSTTALARIHGGENSQQTGDCQGTNWNGPDCTDPTTNKVQDSITSGAEFDLGENS